MKLKELLEQRAALLAEIESADEKRFAEIKGKVAKLDFLIGEARAKEAEATAEQRAKEKAEAEARAARDPNVTPAPGADGENRASVDPLKMQFKTGKPTTETDTAAEQRGADLKAGKKITFEKRSITSGSTALAVHADGDITPAFAQVGTIDKLVKNVSLDGGEAHKVPFVKNFADGGKTAEGGEYSTAEPTFGYAKIGRTKITAYAEITEETLKLPNAQYEAVVREATETALRRKKIGLIFDGGTDDGIVGIVNTPADVMAAGCKKTIAKIDENTIDEIIFNYGGDEMVESDAELILNKLTLKEFAKVKGADKRRAYDIKITGNRGTINLIPFICDSHVKPYGSAGANDPYIYYGKLAAYELDDYSGVEVERSVDYKFKEGMVCYKASQMCGGGVVMYNGFSIITKGTEVAPASLKTNAPIDTPTTPATV